MNANRSYRDSTALHARRRTVGDREQFQALPIHLCASCKAPTRRVRQFASNEIVPVDAYTHAGGDVEIVAWTRDRVLVAARTLLGAYDYDPSAVILRTHACAKGSP